MDDIRIDELIGYLVDLGFKGAALKGGIGSSFLLIILAYQLSFYLQ